MVDVITAEDIPGANGADDDKLLAVDEVGVGHVFSETRANCHPRTPGSQLPLSPSFFYY